MPNRKLTEQQVSEILAARLYEKPTPSYADLSRRFQMTAETIFRICTRVSWQHVPLPDPPAERSDAAGTTEDGLDRAEAEKI